MPEEVEQPERRRSSQKGIAIAATIGLAVGGWVYHFGYISARFENHEERLVHIEQSYVPASVHTERDRFRDEQISQLRAEQADTKEALTRIETKLDRSLLRPTK